MQTTALANRSTDSPPAIEDLEQLVRLSVSAMEHFNAFTREFAAVLRELTDAQEPPALSCTRGYSSSARSFAPTATSAAT